MFTAWKMLLLKKKVVPVNFMTIYIYFFYYLYYMEFVYVNDTCLNIDITRNKMSDFINKLMKIKYSIHILIIKNSSLLSQN